MTRKTASTDPSSRWRDDPEARIAPSPKAAQDLFATGPPSVPREISRQQDPEDQKRGVIGVEPKETDDSAGATFAARLGSPRTSSWLTSAAIHLALLVLLALLTYRLGGSERGIAIDGAVGDRGESVAFEVIEPSRDDQQSANESVESPVPVDVPLVTTTPALSDVVSPLDSAPIESSDLQQLASGGSATSMPQHHYLGGGGLSARTPEGRQKFGDLYGATKESETAVENALRWLAEHQRHDGSWSFDLSLAPCEGQCRHGRKRGEDTPTPTTAATGLALLAFMGAGYTSETGKYQEQVSRGLYYLRNAAVETQFGYDWQQGGSMYGHGIALMAMSEALGMTKRADRYDTDLYHYVNFGAQFTSAAQHRSGSWGYTPGSPGDTTISGWQILSLVGAQKAGVQVRSDLYFRTKEFLMSVRERPEFEFGYRSPEAEPTTTAIALVLLMYLGQTPGHTLFDEAVDRIADRGPTLTNVYHDYYATMALHHFRHRDWEAWNTKLRDHLVRTQATEGHEAGSWHFKDKWGDVGGRVYTTAMCTLILEVYYRFLPLYEEPPGFPL